MKRSWVFLALIWFMRTAYIICCLYELYWVANLNVRFELVDVEAVSSVIRSQTLSVPFLMTGPISYIGGKAKIANRILQTFPQHITSVETFAGGAQVFFHKEPSRVEVLNDLDKDVVTFFRVCQTHYEELIRYLKFMVASREWFELLRDQDPKTLTDVQRAGRFFYLQKNAYAGLIRRRNFRYSVGEPAGFNPQNIPDLIERTHKRLIRVQLECAPYQDVLARYDRPTTLFYLDPPYFGRNLYKFNFNESDFVALESHLTRVKGKFVLSLNDVPEVRQIFRQFHLRGIELAYTAQQTPGKRYRELLITNYRLPSGGVEIAA